MTAPGARTDRDALATIDSAEITAAGPPELLQALSRTMAGVSLQDAQGNPFQPNLVFRGYTASPLQGTAQGLAVYLDGARFNQPFGDTVNFDLLPTAAIMSIAVEEANPVYGLNALGGALVVATKSGRSFGGLRLTEAGGSFGWAEGAAEAGWQSGPWSAYLALQESHDGGWRRHSPSALYNGFADLGVDGRSAGVHLKLIGANSDLTGNGSSPVELLAVDRRAVFTFPDNTRNRFGRASVHPWVALSPATRVEGSLYLQYLRQDTLNGDAADIEQCAEDNDRLCLENDRDEQSGLIGTNGERILVPLDSGRAYGLLNRSETRTIAGGTLLQLVDRRPLLGGTNLFAVGASDDASRTVFRSSSELGALTDERRVDGLGPMIAQPDGSIAPVSLVARTRSIGVFASELLPLGRHFSVDVGVRYTTMRVALNDRIGTDLNGRHRFARVNPAGALAYRLSGALTLRAGYAQANRAPTPAELSCAGPDDPCSLANFFVGDPPLKQVVAKRWEAGAAGRAAARRWQIQWRAAAYRSTNHDDIQFVASPVRGRAYFRNIGETRRQGLEADLTTSRGAWTARLGYALTDATFRTPLTLTSTDNPAAKDDGTIEVRRGDRLPGIPRHRGVLSIDYAGKPFSFGGDVQAQSGQILFGDEANLQPPTQAFMMTDLRASVRLAGPLSAFAEVTNVFDRHTATFGTFSETGQVKLAEAPGADDPRSLGPGAPRRWKAGLKARL